MKNKHQLLNIILAIIILTLIYQLSFNNKKTPISATLPVDKHQAINHTNTNSSINYSNMETLAAIHSRKSVRHFTNQTVTKEQLTNLVKAGMAAPTAVNKQPWAFIAIDNRETLNLLADKLPYAKMLKQAAAAIVVCGDMTKALEGIEQEYWIQDCSAASQNILLAAEALGLGAVWTAAYPSKERIKSVRDILLLPQHIIPLNVIPIGYPTGKDKPKDKWKEENLHWQKW